MKWEIESREENVYQVPVESEIKNRVSVLYNTSGAGFRFAPTVPALAPPIGSSVMLLLDPLPPSVWLPRSETKLPILSFRGPWSLFPRTKKHSLIHAK